MHWEHLPMQLPDWLIKFIMSLKYLGLPWILNRNAGLLLQSEVWAQLCTKSKVWKQNAFNYHEAKQKSGLEYQALLKYFLLHRLLMFSGVISLLLPQLSSFLLSEK